MASNDNATAVAAPPTAVETVKPEETPTVNQSPKSSGVSQPVDTPKSAETLSYVARPAAVDTTAPAPTPAQAKASTRMNVEMVKAEKPKHHHETTEVRVISELHRHGIYW